MQVHFVHFNEYLTYINNEFETNQQNQIRIRSGCASSSETGTGSEKKQ